MLFFLGEGKVGEKNLMVENAKANPPPPPPPVIFNGSSFGNCNGGDDSHNNVIIIFPPKKTPVGMRGVINFVRLH